MNFKLILLLFCFNLFASDPVVSSNDSTQIMSFEINNSESYPRLFVNYKTITTKSIDTVVSAYNYFGWKWSLKYTQDTLYYRDIYTLDSHLDGFDYNSTERLKLIPAHYDTVFVPKKFESEFDFNWNEALREVDRELNSSFTKFKFVK